LLGTLHHKYSFPLRIPPCKLSPVATLARPSNLFRYSTPSPSKSENTSSESEPPSLPDVLRHLFEHSKVTVNQREFADDEGVKYELPENPRYNKNLRQQILILDLETRPLESTDAFRKGEFKWRDINHVSGGIFSHYLYALVHGYDYKLIQAANFKDRHATWIKPSALANHIKDYKFIVFLDADATFRHLHLPLEWMFNYWNIEPKHSITMALDPWDPNNPKDNADRFNRAYTNTGFIVVQNNEKVGEILKAWHECPDNVRYPKCSKWKKPSFHEQSAFGEYIRYDYEDSIKELPCAEANGFPGVQISNCVGKLVRHYWFDKSLIKQVLQENVMQALASSIQRIFADNNPQVILNQKVNQILE
jgi:hypothetical protein